MSAQNASRRRSAFTIIELMIAGTILAIITSLFLSSFSIQTRSYSINEQIVEIQQAVRVIGDVLERDIRHAGFMTPAGGGFCVIDNLAAPDTLFLSDDGAVDPIQENRSDLAARVTPSPVNVVAGQQTFAIDDLVLEIVAPDPAYDTDLNGVSDSDFRPGAGAIIVDAANPERGAACAMVVSLPSATSIELNVLSGAPLAVAAPNTPEITIVPARVYSIAAPNVLMRDNVVIANDVEDFQVAVFVDDDQDGTVDAGEYRGDGVGPNIVPNLINHGRAREIRANLILRTRDQDPGYTSGMFQATENRAPIAGGDGFRRRIWTSTTMLRNIGMGGA